MVPELRITMAGSSWRARRAGSDAILRLAALVVIAAAAVAGAPLLHAAEVAYRIENEPVASVVHSGAVEVVVTPAADLRRGMQGSLVRWEAGRWVRIASLVIDDVLGERQAAGTAVPGIGRSVVQGDVVWFEGMQEPRPPGRIRISSDRDIERLELHPESGEAILAGALSAGEELTLGVPTGRMRIVAMSGLREILSLSTFVSAAAEVTLLLEPRTEETSVPGVRDVDEVTETPASEPAMQAPPEEQPPPASPASPEDAIRQLVVADRFEEARRFAQRMVSDGMASQDVGLWLIALDLQMGGLPSVTLERLRAERWQGAEAIARAERLAAIAGFPREGELTCWACGAGNAKAAVHCSNCLMYLERMRMVHRADRSEVSEFTWDGGTLARVVTVVKESASLGAQGRSRPGARRHADVTEMEFTTTNGYLSSVTLRRSRGPVELESREFAVSVPTAAERPIDAMLVENPETLGRTFVPERLVPYLPWNGLLGGRVGSAGGGSIGHSLDDGRTLTWSFDSGRLARVRSSDGSLDRKLARNAKGRLDREELVVRADERLVERKVTVSHDGERLDRIEIDVPGGNVQVNFVHGR